MNRTIFKYQFEPADRVSLPVLAGSVPLSVGLNNGRFTAWCLTDRDRAKDDLEQLTLLVVGTGHPLPDDADRCLGRIELGAMPLVFHVFTVRAT